jgi:hypothetical protein
VGNGLRGYLTQRFRFEIFERKRSLDILQETELGRAKYVVREGSIKIEHRGSLCGAINKAERDFKEKNKRGKIQKYYSVYIMLGNQTYNIPKKFWGKYLKEHPTSQ